MTTLKKLDDINQFAQQSQNVISLDQFYTRCDLAEKYVTRILRRWSAPDVLFIEPAAGTGAFLNPLIKAERKILAIDIDPYLNNIKQMDFLNSTVEIDGNHSAIIAIGNPPFGKKSSAAVKFFNKAAEFADEISFIVPRTFRKISVQKRLHAKYHLQVDEDVEKNAFLRFGKPYDVPCAWQIWSRSQDDRIIQSTPSVAHLIEYTTPQAADFAIRRVGFYAGRIITENIQSLSETTHYFVREVTVGIIDVMRCTNWSEIAKQTVGVSSLSKSEIAIKLDEIHCD